MPRILPSIKIRDDFIKIAKSNRKRYVVLDSSYDTKDVENQIFKRFSRFVNR